MLPKIDHNASNENEVNIESDLNPSIISDKEENILMK